MIILVRYVFYKSFLIMDCFTILSISLSMIGVFDAGCQLVVDEAAVMNLCSYF